LNNQTGKSAFVLVHALSHMGKLRFTSTRSTLDYGRCQLHPIAASAEQKSLRYHLNRNLGWPKCRYAMGNRRISFLCRDSKSFLSVSSV